MKHFWERANSLDVLHTQSDKYINTADVLYKRWTLQTLCSSKHCDTSAANLVSILKANRNKISVYPNDSLLAVTATLNNAKVTSWQFIFSDLGVFVKRKFIGSKDTHEGSTAWRKEYYWAAIANKNEAEMI